MVYYDEHPCSTPEGFFDAISLSTAPFVLQGRYHWMFRGQPAPDSLVPSGMEPSRASDKEGDSYSPWTTTGCVL